MNKETIEKILSGEKKTIRIDGYTYEIAIDKNTKRVELLGSGSRVSSDIRTDDYKYTHGGSVYRHATQIAWEIRREMATDTDE